MDFAYITRFLKKDEEVMFRLCKTTNQDLLYYNITVEEREALLKLL